MRQVQSLLRGFVGERRREEGQRGKGEETSATANAEKSSSNEKKRFSRRFFDFSDLRIPEQVHRRSRSREESDGSRRLQPLQTFAQQHVAQFTGEIVVEFGRFGDEHRESTAT